VFWFRKFDTFKGQQIDHLNGYFAKPGSLLILERGDGFFVA